MRIPNINFFTGYLLYIDCVLNRYPWPVGLPGFLLLPACLQSSASVFCFSLLLQSSASVYCFSLQLQSTASVYCFSLLLQSTASVFSFSLLLQSTASVFCFSLQSFASVFFQGRGVPGGQTKLPGLEQAAHDFTGTGLGQAFLYLNLARVSMGGQLLLSVLADLSHK